MIAQIDKVSRVLKAVAGVVVAYFTLSRLLYLAYSANLGLLCMPHPPQFNVSSWKEAK